MNKKKTDQDRMRDRLIGVPFPPKLVPELQQIAEDMGLSMAGVLRFAYCKYRRSLKKAA